MISGMEGILDRFFITNRAGSRAAIKLCSEYGKGRFFDRFFRYSVIPFILNFDRDSFDPSNRKVVDIEVSHYCFNYTGVTMALSAIAEALYYGYVPLVDVRQKGAFNWTDFFEQPFSVSETAECDIYPRSVGAYKWHGSMIGNKPDMEAWYKIYALFYRLNEETSGYVDGEFMRMFQDIDEKKTLGILCRGTDYVKLKPRGHFVQPDICTIIEEAGKLMESGRFTHIYLASEDGGLAERVKKAFPGKVLENSREYYDQAYFEGDHNKIGDLNSEMSDDRIRAKDLSYISSINILSKCGGLVAGNCGGSQAAVCINGGRYDYCHVYDLGLY